MTWHINKELPSQLCIPVWLCTSLMYDKLFRPQSLKFSAHLPWESTSLIIQCSFLDNVTLLEWFKYRVLNNIFNSLNNTSKKQSFFNFIIRLRRYVIYSKVYIKIRKKGWNQFNMAMATGTYASTIYDVNLWAFKSYAPSTHIFFVIALYIVLNHALVESTKVFWMG